MEIHAIKWQISEPWQICLLLCRTGLPWLHLSVSISLLIPMSFLLPGLLPVLKAHPAMGSAGLGTAAAQGQWGVGHKFTPRVNLLWVNCCLRLLKWGKKKKKIKSTQQGLETPVKNAASVYDLRREKVKSRREGAAWGAGKAELQLCPSWCSPPCCSPLHQRGDIYLPPKGSWRFRDESH